MRKFYALHLQVSKFKSRAVALTLSCLAFAFAMLPVDSFANDFTGTWTSVVPNITCTGSTANYTLKATNATDPSAAIAEGNAVVINFPAGFNLSGITGGTMNTKSIVGITKGITTVSFNVPATAVVAAGGSITIVLNGIVNNNTSGDYQLSMTIAATAGNQDVFNSGQFTIDPVITPNITIGSDDADNSICAGSSITFTANSTSSVVSPLYQWQVNGLNVGSNSSVNTFTIPTTLSSPYTPYGTNPFVVTVVLTSGVTPCERATSSGISVTVNAIPATPAASNSGPVCAGSTLILSTPTVVGATYSWTGPNSFSSTSQNPSIANATTAATGAYSVTVTLNGCTSAAGTTNATVNAIPATPAASNSGPVCAGSTLILSTPTVVGATYSWTGPNSFSSTSQNPSIANATTAATGTYSVTVTLNGCTSAAGTTNATVNAIPTITGTTPGDICVSGNTVLSATATNGSVINWYDASTGGAIRGNGNNFSTDNISATRTYYVDATANGCTSTPRIPVVAAVNARPTITSTTNNSRCGNGAVTLNATSSSGTVNWYANASGGSSLASGTTYSPNISSTTTYYVDATISGCTTSSRTAVTATKYTAAPSVGSGNQPVNMPTGPQSICPPVSNLVYNIPASMTSMNKDASTYYKWSLPPGFVITSGDSTSQITVSVSAGAPTIIGNNQNVSVIAYNPCGNSGTSPRPLAVNVNSYAGINAGPNQNICVGTSATMVATYSGNTSSSTWSLSGSGTFSDRTSPTSTFTPSITSGDVTLTITTNDPSGVCNASSSQVTITIDPLPTAVAGGSTTICSNGTATVSGATATNGTILWTTSNGGGSISNATTLTPTYNPVAADGGKTVTLTMTVTGSGTCSSQNATANYTITVNQLPQITSPDFAPRSVCASFPVTFSVTATGTGLTYQWYKDGIALADTAGVITGVNSANLSLPQAKGSQAGTYTVRVSGVSPCGFVTSSDAVLTVNQQIDIISQPVSQTICEGLTTTFEVQATGSIYGYVWRRNGTPVSGSPYSGENSASLTITGARPSDNGNYDVVVSAPSGTCSQIISSPPAVLTVTPTVGTPTAITVSAGTEPTCQLLNGTTTTTYATTATNNTGFNWSITNAAAGAIDAATGVMTWANGFSGSVDIQVTASGCNGPSAQVVRTVTIAPTNTAASPSSLPTLCINTAISPAITIATTGATGIGTPTGLPAGVTASWASNTITISGTPTASGTFNYSIPLSGGCGTVNATGTITVTPANTAGTPSSTPTLCVNTALTNITIATTGATGIGTPTNLPAGVTATWASNTITISGTPTASGTFNYSIPLSGGCGTVNATGTITVTPTNTAGAPSSIPTLCVNTALTNITIATTGATGIGIPTGLPAGVTASWASNTITISGTPTASGTFNYSIPLSGGCGTVNATGTITVTPASFGGTLSPALVTACAGTSTGTITLSGKTGNIVRWESSTNGGVNWTPIATTTTSYNYSVTQTTLFRAVIQSGPCALAYSSTALVSVITSVSPVALASPAAICVGQQSTLSTTLNQTIGITDGSGNFNTASNSSGWGWNKCYLSNCVNAGADAGGPTPWLLTTSEKVNPPLISYNSGDNKFAVVRGSASDWGNGDTSVLETPAFSLIGQTSSIFQFNQGYFLNPGASISIEISTDNGNNYSAILSQIDGQATSPGLSGTTITLQPTTISLANYIGLSNLKIRFKYKGSAGSSWALDNIALPTANPVTYQWTANPASPNSFVGSNTTSPVNVNPTTTTTYTLTTMLNGCATGSSTVTVTVNPLPTITLAGGSGGVVTICNSPSAQTLSMSYTTTNLSAPATYSITWSAAAKNAGFVDVGPVSLPAGSISLAIPAGAAAGNYGGTVFLTNANGCSNSGAPFSVTINPLPTGTLSGDAAICKGGSTPLTLVLTGPGTISGTLSDGTPFSGTAGTITVNVNPAVTTTYQIATLTNGTCASLAANISGSPVITVSDPAAIDVQPVSSSICSNTATSFTVTATGTGVNYQWQVDKGSGFTDITDGGVYSGVNTSTLNISKATADMVGYKYQAKLTTGAPCSSSLTSNVVPLLISYVWTGVIDTVWNTPGNWSDGSVPGTSCPVVTIPVVITNNYPVLKTGPMATIISLQIDANASAKITGNTMQLAGSITNNGIFDVTDGTVEFNGTTGTQNIAGSNFKNNIPGKNNTVKNLIISNNVNVANTAGDTLNITGLLSFSTDNTTLTTGDNLTLKSTKDNTASIGALAGNNVVSGQVEVERYLNIGTTAGTHPKSWQFLSTPAKGQSLVNSWMEGIGGITNTNSTGYGAQFTGT
ncbi:MAG: hypothetical protein ACTHM7_18300, partial [Ginsengibacter sp.]